MTVKVVSAKVKLNRAALRAIQQRTKSELQTWARDVLNRRVEPVTPIDTGALRRSGDILVEGGDKVSVWWFWMVPYAGAVERMRDYGKAPRTPGTKAPFAVPTIRQAIEEESDKPIGKAFGGK